MFKFENLKSRRVRRVLFHIRCTDNFPAILVNFSSIFIRECIIRTLPLSILNRLFHL